MSSGRDGADERFAAAWDERMRGHAPRRSHDVRRSDAPFTDRDGRPTSIGSDDPGLADDLRVADLLRRAGNTTAGADPEASRRMRAAVMASVTGGAAPTRTDLRREDVAAGAVGVGTHGRRRAARRRAGERPGDGRPASSGPAAGPGRSARRGSTARRLLSSTMAGFACILALGALTVLLSRGALPGDMLYGLKRASESAEIGLTSGQEAKATKHLDIAALRLDEVQQMVQRDTSTASGSLPVAAAPGSTDAALISDNLRAFDQQARTGASMLLPLVTRPSGPSASMLTSWVGAQQTVLDQVSPSIPDAGRDQAATTRRLLDQLRTRAAAFERDPSCGDASASDELGPLPTAACAADPGSAAPAPVPAAPPATTTSSSTASSTTETTTTTATTTTSQDAPSSSASRTSAPSRSTASTPAPISVPVPVPGLPKVEVPPLLPGLPGLSLG